MISKDVLVASGYHEYDPFGMSGDPLCTGYLEKALNEYTITVTFWQFEENETQANFVLQNYGNLPIALEVFDVIDWTVEEIEGYCARVYESIKVK